jgi:hypothetical protein
MLEHRPQPLNIILLIAFGPAVLFAAGIDAWPLVAFVLALIAFCLGLARLSWRKSPETEWFAFGWCVRCSSRRAPRGCSGSS